MDFNEMMLQQLNDAVTRMNEIDSKTGDESSSARAQLNEMARQNEGAVKTAKDIIDQVNTLDEETKLLVSRILTTQGNKVWKETVDKWIEENKSTTTVEKPSDEELKALAAERSQILTLAKAVRTALVASGANPESIPSIPSARKGSRGKRGPMVRGYNFLIDNGKVTFTTFGNVITSAKSNQKAAREAMAAQGLDISELPETWTLDLNGHTISAFPKAQDEPDLDDEEDDEEDEDDDTED